MNTTPPRSFLAATSLTLLHPRASTRNHSSPTRVSYTMKTFVRHLRTRPKLLRPPARTPHTNPNPNPTSAPTPEPLLHPPSSSSSSPLARWRPSSTRLSPDAPSYLPPHDRVIQRPLPLPLPLHNPPPKEQRQKAPRLKLSDIVPTGLTRYAYRWETVAPSEEQVQRADTFFLRYPPKYLWSQAKFKAIDFGDVPEVVFLGRSNVGKSSMLNALLNNKSLAYTSSKPGRTRLMNAFGIADGRMVLVDMPGYGHASREEWGVQIMKYLKSRKQFRRAFLLVDAKHGLKKNDLLLLHQFGQEGISFQIVLSKIDRVKPDEVTKLFDLVRGVMEKGIGGTNAGLGEILATAAAPIRKGEKKVGMSELRWAIMVACGLENVRLGAPRGAKIGLEEQIEAQIEGEGNQY